MKVLILISIPVFLVKTFVTQQLHSTQLNNTEVFKRNKDDFHNYVIREMREKSYRGNYLTDKCAAKIIKKKMKYSGNTYLIVADGLNHEFLLHDLQGDHVHTFYTELELLGTTHYASLHHLLIFDKMVNIDVLLKKMMPPQGTKFFVMAENYQEATEMFGIFWKFRIVHVVISFTVNETVFYYTYFPYTESHCGKVGTPQLLAQCDASSGVVYHQEKFFPQKAKNLHRCPINITFIENVPSSYYSESKVLTGWEVDLMNEIVKHLNGLTNYHIISSKKTIYKPLEGYAHLVKNSEAGGGLVVSLKSLVKTDFCMYGQSLCTTWIVPRKTTPQYSYNFIYKVFPTTVWLLLLLSLFSVAAVYRIFFKVTCANVIFKLIPYLFGTTTRTKKTSKLMGTFWVWFCIGINSIYQSGYQSRLLVPNKTPQISSTREVLESNLKILGVFDIITDAIPYFKHRYNVSSRRLRLINRKLSYDDWIYRMTVKKDSAYLGFKETVRYHTDRTELEKKLFIPEHCVIKHMLSFVLKKNSHLTESFIQFSKRLSENGFVVFFTRKHLSRESKRNVPKKITKILKPSDSDDMDSPPSINMDKMCIVFMCHFTGVTIALIVFFIEIMSTWNWTKIKRKIIQEIESAWTCDSV